MADLGEAALVVDRLGAAEINDGQVVLVTEHDVVRLQVAMNHAGFVNRAERARDLRENLQPLYRRDSGLDPVSQIACAKILHRQIGTAIVVVEIKYSCHIGTADLLNQRKLLHETLDHPAVAA